MSAKQLVSFVKFVAVQIVILFLFTQCDDAVQEIDWETKNIPNKLIVDGHISNKLSKHPIKLTRSDDYFANLPERMVSGASVIIDSENGNIIYAEKSSEPWVYEALEPFVGEVSVKYTLKIDLNAPLEGTDYYEAETQIIEGMRLDLVEAYLYNNPTPMEDTDSIILIIVLHGLEPVNIENYYMAKAYRNGELITDTIQDFTHFSDQDYGMNGESIFYMIYEDYFEPNDTFAIDLISIPKDYEYFLTGLGQLSVPEDPFGFSGPPANVVGNVNKGNALGFFYSSYIQSASTVVVDATY
jgi:hypothetical protein